MQVGTINTAMVNPYQQKAKIAELEDLKEKANLKEEKELRGACQQFEGILLQFMLKEMRKTVPEEKLFHGGQGESMFKDLQDQEIAAEISKSNRLGLSDVLYRQLSREGSKVVDSNEIDQIVNNMANPADNKI